MPDPVQLVEELEEIRQVLEIVERIRTLAELAAADPVESFLVDLEVRWLERSADVKVLQGIAGVTIDGIYGPETRAGHLDLVGRYDSLDGSRVPDEPEPAPTPDVRLSEPTRPTESTLSAPIPDAPYGELLAAYFPSEWLPWAVRVMFCESGGNPNATNPSSGAAGLFQHLPQFWPGRAAAAGFPGASPYDPEANIAASAYLLATGGAQHWVCR
jgi:hypothetical protein